MGIEEKTDYRKSTPEVLYQMRKTVIALFKKQKSVEEIIEVTDFSERTVRETIRKYKSGGMAALECVSKCILAGIMQEEYECKPDGRK